MSRRFPLPVLSVLVAAMAIAGCGGDSEKVSDESLDVPQLTIPTERTPARTDTDGSTTETDGTQTSTDGTQTGSSTTPQTTSPSGGQQAPGTGTQQDTPQNDQPPPDGSPAQQFEQFCAENPGAC